ncbi:MAG TPA: sugar transferase [Candidatus Krumholzibacteria bacterium]|nr:sugar transferase [Candidatus Krumholzibacteria bacterium]
MNDFAQKFARRSEFALPWAARAVNVTRRTPTERIRHPFDLVGRLGWKRGVDIALSTAGLLVTSPVMALAAVIVTTTSPGPVFYRQERIGINRRSRERRGSAPRSETDRRRRDRRVLVNFGRPFTIYKFRTMVVDAERGTPPLWAKERDPRITSVGRMLRKTRIDELPQFWNVLRGDMSIVGPRPERAYFIGRIEKELPEFQLRLRTKPGITGLAQVQLGYTNTDDGLRDKLHLDLEYIRRVSLWTDMKILCRTVFVVFTGKGAC